MIRGMTAQLRSPPWLPGVDVPEGTLKSSLRVDIARLSMRALIPLTGRQRYLKETAATYGDAEHALTSLQSRVDENRHPKTAITVGQAITRWLNVAKLEDTTRDRYEDLVRIYIKPRIADVVAGKLDAEMLESFYARLLRCRELCAGRSRAGHKCRPLTGSTVRKIHYVISAALEQAVRWRHLGVNPAAVAIAPSANHTEPTHPVPRRPPQSSAPHGATRTGACSCGSS
jgi:integrase